MEETRQYAYLTENVMREDFRYAWKQEDLWELAKTKKVVKYRMNDVKHWVYNSSWSNKDCFVSIFQVLMQPKMLPEIF